MDVMEIDRMPDQARLWVYQADRKLSDEEVARVHDEVAGFTANWQAHGQPLQAAFEIKYGQFIILAVDESYHQASGCSIDDSVTLIRRLEAVMGVSFLDRSKVAVLKDGSVELFPLHGIKQAVSSGVIGPETVVINNAVSSYGDFKRSWKQPALESWVKRFF